MHTLTITTADGRTWSSVLQDEGLALLLAEAEQATAAVQRDLNDMARPSDEITPADVAATLLAEALRRLQAGHQG